MWEVDLVLRIPTENQKDRELITTLKMLSPGTALRDGIEYILQANTGGLIVVGDSPEVLNLTEGGFRINCPYLPARLSELAKMDGAIILSSDMKRIVRANVTLKVSPSISSNETGLRHRAAEKFAKETGNIVIAVSRRRNTLTLYKKNQHYLFRDRPILISGANQTMLSLTQYAKTMQQVLATLNWAELSGTVNLGNVVTAIQACERFRRTEHDLNLFRIELGTEALSLQLIPAELTAEINRALLIIRDYFNEDFRAESEVYEHVFSLNESELSDASRICEALGYPHESINSEETLEPRGYRMLSQISRIPDNVVENIVNSFKSLDAIITSNVNTLQEVEGVGKLRATAIKDALVQMKTGSTQPQVLAMPIFNWD